MQNQFVKEEPAKEKHRPVAIQRLAFRRRGDKIKGIEIVPKLGADGFNDRSKNAHDFARPPAPDIAEIV
jgi:hypothetical protein